MASAKTGNGKGEKTGTQEDPRQGGPQTEGQTQGQQTASNETDSSDPPGLVKKISVKTVVGDLKGMILDGKIQMPCDVMVVVGEANNIEDGVGNMGPWAALVGQFKATNLVTGEIFIGPRLFLPEPAGKLLVDQARQFVIESIPLSAEDKAKPIFQQVQRYRANGDSVEIAILVGIIRNDRPSGQPYEFTLKPLTQVQRTDRFARLDALVNAKVKIPARKALPAPTN